MEGLDSATWAENGVTMAFSRGFLVESDGFFPDFFSDFSLWVEPPVALFVHAVEPWNPGRLGVQDVQSGEVP